MDETVLYPGKLIEVRNWDDFVALWNNNPEPTLEDNLNDLLEDN